MLMSRRAATVAVPFIQSKETSMTNATASNDILYVGIELSKTTWRLAFSNGAKIR
jgi:hypothetical protein